MTYANVDLIEELTLESLTIKYETLAEYYSIPNAIILDMPVDTMIAQGGQYVSPLLCVEIIDYVFDGYITYLNYFHLSYGPNIMDSYMISKRTKEVITEIRKITLRLPRFDNPGFNNYGSYNILELRMKCEIHNRRRDEFRVLNDVRIQTRSEIDWFEDIIEIL